MSTQSAEDTSKAQSRKRRHHILEQELDRKAARALSLVLEARTMAKQLSKAVEAATAHHQYAMSHESWDRMCGSRSSSACLEGPKCCRLYVRSMVNL